MMNQYPLWKYILVLLVVLVGSVYALPNLFGEDPAIQISGTRVISVDDGTLKTVEAALENKNITYKSIALDERGIIVRFDNTDVQLQAQNVLRESLDAAYVVALNLAPATPGWLQSINALPMYLGLDLRGGVHFLMEVDMNAAISQALERYKGDFRSILRENKVRYLNIDLEGSVAENTGHVLLKFRDAGARDEAKRILRNEFRELDFKDKEEGEYSYLLASLTDLEITETKRFALQQNITTLRNRVNELGVAEPVIQQQGLDRIVVQLPGVQDTARAKEILGATATLEFRMVEEEHSVQAALRGRVPPGTSLYRNPIWQPSGWDCC